MRRVLLALVFVAGCSSPTAPAPPVFWVPPNAVEYAQPSEYVLWWYRVLTDIGVPNVPESRPPRPPLPTGVRWFLVTSGAWNDPGGGMTEGLAAPDLRIFIAHPYKLKPSLIHHEMLHAALRIHTGSGDKNHTNPLFAVYDAIPWFP